MLRIALLLLCLQITLLGQAQQRSEKSPLYREIESTIKLKGAPISINVFEFISNEDLNINLKFNKKAFTNKLSNSLIQVQLPISGDDKNLTLILREQSISLGKYKTAIKTYRGVIIGEYRSWVTLNVSSKEVNGIIARAGENLIIETTPQGSLTLYNSAQKPSESWICHNPEHDGSDKTSDKAYKNQSHGDTVSVYIDCDYALYQSRGSSISNTINYVQSLMNDVSVIYLNENITLVVDDIHVWDTVDPYHKENATVAIHNFRSELDEEFNADLAILLSTNPALSGGIAFVDGFCDKTRAYSYANLNSTVPNGSDYSLQTHVISHEIGHNLGSPHTNDCSWGPNGDRALDDCIDNSCAEVPGSVRGTIMSNCHLSGRGGVFFSRGFGQEPGDLIRSKVAECNAIEGKNCSEAIPIAVSGVDTTIQIIGSITGKSPSQPDADASTWYQFIPEGDGYVTMNACNQGVDTRFIIHEGSCDNLSQLLLQDDHCDIGIGLIYASGVDSFPVLAGLNYYIEWDDRWTSEGFTYYFRYDQTIVADDPCTNGILDNGEEQIDCGGTSCIPCDLCDSDPSRSQSYSNNYEYRSNLDIVYMDTIDAPTHVIISSAGIVSFEAGFEVDLGATLQVLQESCTEYIDRVTD